MVTGGSLRRTARFYRKTPTRPIIALREGTAKLSKINTSALEWSIKLRGKRVTFAKLRSQVLSLVSCAPAITANNVPTIFSVHSILVA